jgi:NADH-quinone oxidoreductase subunit M
MIAVSIGFGLFPMHLYNVVRSGVDPLVAKITHVVPIAEAAGAKHQARGEESPPTAAHPLPLAASRETGDRP